MNDTERGKKKPLCIVVKDKIQEEKKMYENERWKHMLLSIRFGFIDEQRTLHFLKIVKCWLLLIVCATNIYRNLIQPVDFVQSETMEKYINFCDFFFLQSCIVQRSALVYDDYS